MNSPNGTPGAIITDKAVFRSDMTERNTSTLSTQASQTGDPRGDRLGRRVQGRSDSNEPPSFNKIALIKEIDPNGIYIL
jgi:hypothetical protein